MSGQVSGTSIQSGKRKEKSGKMQRKSGGEKCKKRVGRLKERERVKR